ncbi:BTAD domain-containing putative transcriptional regulator [Kribbella sp. NPDC056951]|uniref:AfsR/SARP family transcriptional regulator n=1 Tax=Kribbella sp. NPDC056951 TaxID=3345978 RepID=UPI00362D5E84
MEYGVLGEVVPTELGHLRQRSVLAVLLLGAGRPVTADQLVDRVWGDSAPQRARETLYAYLSRLRTVLDAELVRQSGGYVLQVDPDQVDVHRFRRLVVAAGAEESVALFEEALGLWRGEALADLDTPWFVEQRERLHAERFAAELDLTDLQLAQNEYGDLLPVLRSRSQAHPLDERVAGHLMLALQRADRAADALQEYDRIRRALVDELAIEPSARLQQLQQQLLGTTQVDRVVPQQLPAAPATLIGRDPALKQLTTALAGDHQQATVAVSAVGGAGGIGKTSLVLHWAHRNLARFPDGQLFIDLRGFDPVEPPLPVETAMSGLLQALGAGRLPPDPQARAGLYRTMLAGKRLLLVLDNAKESSQVAPLLPGTAGCTVIVTSRNRLGGLLTRHGAVPVDLDVLDPADARDLLQRQIGADRASAEPAAFDELLTHCAGLPLALAIVAARIAGRPDFPLSAFADELRDTEARLDAFEAGELDAGLRSVFDCSYRALDRDAAALLALLARVPGQDISTASVAALVDGNPRRSLARLESAHLIRQHAPGRYSLHDLIRLYAREQKVDDSQALWRLADHYRRGAVEADRVIAPERSPVNGDQIGPLGLKDRDEASAWVDAEADNLLATQRLAMERGWHDIVWHLAYGLVVFQSWRGQDTLTAEMWANALTVVPELDDAADQSMVHRYYGRSRGLLGERDEALSHLEQALVYAARSGRPTEHAACLQMLAGALCNQDDYEAALPYGLAQLELYKTFGKQRWLADSYNIVGWIHAKLGHYEEARAACLASLEIFEQTGDHDSRGDVLDSLGTAALAAGRFDEALVAFEDALRSYEQVGNVRQIAETRDHIGDVHHARGDLAEARTAWQDALTAYSDQGREQQAESVRVKLTALDAER